MKLATLFVATILGGCATGTARIGGPDLSTNGAVPKPLPAVLLGRDGETASHLYARLLARDCVDDETEHVVAQVVARLDACEADGQRACERKTCDALRHDAPGRCAADLQIAINARNRP